MHCFKFAVRGYFQVSGTNTKVSFVVEFDIENGYYPSFKYAPSGGNDGIYIYMHICV